MFHRVQGWGSGSNAEVAEAVGLARRAMEAGKDDPDALWMAANSVSVFAGEHATAATAVDRALSLNAHSAHAWVISGYLSNRRNRPGPAIAAFQYAMRLSPLDPLNYLFSAGVSLAHLAAGRYGEAINWADWSLREQLRYSPAMRYKVICLTQLGRLDDARGWLNRLLGLQPGLTIAKDKAMYGATQFPPEMLAIFLDGLGKAGLPEG